MSTSVMAVCWPLQMPPTPKAVLMSLADNANDHGECWPSIDRICTRTCLHRATVIRAIGALEQLGHLVADRSNGRKTRYCITPNLDLFEGEKPVAERNQSHNATGSAAQQTGRAARLDRSQKATKPVAQSDTNRQEPPRTTKATAIATGTRLPEDWQPSTTLREWAASEFPGINLKAALDEFRDYWKGVPGQRGRKSDWDATFRNRVREIARRQPRGSNYANGNAGGALSAADRVARANAEAEADDDAIDV
jgi:hypothetical protein